MTKHFTDDANLPYFCSEHTIGYNKKGPVLVSQYLIGLPDNLKPDRLFNFCPICGIKLDVTTQEWKKFCEED